MNRALRERIKEEAENSCGICGCWCGEVGTPHHIIKVGEAKMLENCKTNVIWVCPQCHLRTETEPGYNKKLQQKLQEVYFKKFGISNDYAAEEISEKVTIPLKIIEKAMTKYFLKWEYIDGIRKTTGLEVIRFLMGGYLK